MKKLIRVTTSDISLFLLLRGQLKYLNNHYEVIGLSADTGLLHKVEKREGIRVIELAMRRDISLSRDLLCLWHMIKIFKREKPFIVHANTPKGSLLAMMAALVTRVPHRIYTVTGLRYQGASGVGRFVLMSMERLTCLCANKVIPEGEGVKRTLIADGITRKPLKVIHNGNINGINTHYFSPEGRQTQREETRRRLGIEADEFAFVFIGRIVKDKGMDELAEAMNRLLRMNKKCKLMLVGWFEREQGSITEEHENFFRNNDSVSYVGYKKDVRPYLAAADALVFPSYREGFPRVVLEAGAMGLPSIVTDINGCNEIIVEGENGVIIPPRDKNSLYEAMLHFIDNPDKTTAMAANARRMIQEKYEHQDVVEALLEMYQGLEGNG
ncbi:MAG: glycosyltransferase family 4 protein [Prevotella sp.]|nr:glycosyltransferase family 4 protein [Prevotella sp.]